MGSAFSVLGPLATPAAVGATGTGDATATLTTSQVVNGIVRGVYIKYEGSPPGTTDVTVATASTAPQPPAQTILAVANGNTDGWRYPVAVGNLNTTGAALADGFKYVPIMIANPVTITIAEANDADYIQVWLLMECI